jgi:hypothetical protein
MSLTLVTNPVGSATKKLFAGFGAINFEFKREDLAIDDIENGTGGAQINVSSDLTSYLSEGDSIYVYSQGADYTYNGLATILSITSTDITVDMPYIQSATGGYINYFKNYYVELQCVNATLPEVNILPFTMQSDGDAEGNINIDVSVAVDQLTQRGAIVQGQIPESSVEFEVRYRQVYTGSSESYTLIDSKLLVVLYCTETPAENEILNSFDLPKLFLGYPGAIVIANNNAILGETKELVYSELDINQTAIASGSLGSEGTVFNGFILWKWLANASVNSKTKYIDFNLLIGGAADFADPDFDSPDFVIT